MFPGSPQPRAAFGGTTLRQARVAEFTVAEAAYGPGLRVPCHTHDHAHLGFLLEGSCSESIGRRTYRYEPLQVVVKEPGESHSNLAGDAGTRFLIVDVAGERGRGAFGERLQLRGPELAALGLRLRAELHENDACSPLAIEGLVLELLAAISRHRGGAREGDAPEWLRRARELMHDRCTEALSLADIARAAGVHPSHLARSFRRQFGMTAGQYLRRLRLERAVELLIRTDRPLAAVASEAGFYDQSHLNRAVKRGTGATPAQLRRRARPS